MLSYTAPKATVQQLLLKHHSPAASVIYKCKVLHRLNLPHRFIGLMLAGAVMSSADT
jgi:hypothetical protein